MKKLSETFKALSDDNRLKILQLIAQQEEVCACDITEAFDLKQPTISHHLKVLADAELIIVEKRGKWCFYTINYEAFKNLQQSLNDVTLNIAPLNLKLSDSLCDGCRKKK